ncbi:hypothetical protein L484_002286 [Morus notabilis]|uniref:Uncharacterized protein n=1 Tax=Morus notabilis TaxID=981085 RepID=W9QNC2_9ROSA|nr:hypothetical protein L484_002286 [Morus notabilis]
MLRLVRTALGKGSLVSLFPPSSHGFSRITQRTRARSTVEKQWPLPFTQLQTENFPHLQQHELDHGDLCDLLSNSIQQWEGEPQSKTKPKEKQKITQGWKARNRQEAAQPTQTPTRRRLAGGLLRGETLLSPFSSLSLSCSLAVCMHRST